MKRRAKSTRRGQPQPTDQLVGKVVHAAFRGTMLMNEFAVILQETAKTVVLAHLATEEINAKNDRGYERPLLQDGKAAAAALIKVFRAAVSRVIDTRPPLPTAPLLARLRMDDKFFQPRYRVRQQQPKPGEALVELIRVNKDESPGGPISFPYKRGFCRYYLWDGQAKYFDHND